MKPASERRRLLGDMDIHDASAMILRGGVAASAATMLLGVAVTLRQGRLPADRLNEIRFSGNIGLIFVRAASGDGQALTELGILLLVLTPILRVAASMVLFAFEEKDALYALLTAVVLVLTLASLLVLG